MRGTEYRGLRKADGPIVMAARTENAGFSELVRIRDRYGALRMGRVVDISEQAIAIQLFSDNSGISLEEAWVEYLEKPLEFRVGGDIVGRIFNGLGKPIDGYPEIASSDLRQILIQAQFRFRECGSGKSDPQARQGEPENPEKHAPSHASPRCRSAIGIRSEFTKMV